MVGIKNGLLRLLFVSPWVLLFMMPVAALGIWISEL